ncbi:WxcM-like domain-containing protein [Candidatus Woesearchaeota archaeon]|nr:WxcM-like domain-containing protein [Candidatus Woesearchaeota archaeon]
MEKHDTKNTSGSNINGSLAVVWRDWDNLIKYEPKMVYVSSVNAGEIKGPHLHTKRNSYFVCIHGKVVFVIKDKKGNYKEIESSAEEPVLIFVPKNVPSAHINLSDDTSRVLTLADLAWKPNDNEMINVSFDDYDWEKINPH